MLLVVCSFSIFAAEPNTQALSEALGHWIGKNLHELPLDFEALAKGLKDQAEGKQSPMNEAECLQALGALEEGQKAEQISKLRAQADQFLQQNQQNPKVRSLVEGRVQYEVLKEGRGDPLAVYNSPLVRFSGRDEEVLSLDAISQGLRMAIEGMREGEVRKIFIHPDLGNKETLSILELELIRLDASGESIQPESLSEIAPLR